MKSTRLIFSILEVGFDRDRGVNGTSVCGWDSQESLGKGWMILEIKHPKGLHFLLILCPCENFENHAAEDKFPS